MELLIIGQSVLDTIIQRTGKLDKPGGIFYTALGMSAVKSDADKIYLLTTIDRNRSYFDLAFKELDLSLVQQVEEIPKVRLELFENRERDETYSKITERIKIDIDSLPNNIDGILINMISGFDIDLNDLKLISEAFKVPVYLDVHSLARNVDENGKRFFRPIPNIKDWLAHVDILQANENETQTVHQCSSQFEAAEFVLSCGPKVFLQTKGGKGVRAFWKKNGELNSYWLPAEKTKVVNKVGCGDIFGAVFFYSYIKSNNLMLSLINGNKAAGISTTLDSLESFKLLFKIEVK